MKAFGAATTCGVAVDDVRVGRALEEMFGVVPPDIGRRRTPSAMLITAISLDGAA